LITEFRLKGTLVDFRTVKVGNINDTYIMTTCAEDGLYRNYTVQKLNHHVFRHPQWVAENAYAVTTHMERKQAAEGLTDLRRRVLHLYRREDGSFFYRTEKGEYWRVLSYIYDSHCGRETDFSALYGTGYAFGRFQRSLLDFPAETLRNTIPDFHNTPRRFSALRAAAVRDAMDRAREAEPELNYLFSMEPHIARLEVLHQAGKLPLRVIHGDTKSNNVMFDNSTGAPLAVVDLDTVMPGYMAHDFGDAVRFACNTASEDEEDLSAVSLCLDRYTALAKGFLTPLSSVITEIEEQTLPDGVLIITLELAARFLTDYLEGDVYFKCDKSNHNLHRARCQIALAKDISSKMDEMHRILNAFVIQK
jgi:hypothetical protein